MKKILTIFGFIFSAFFLFSAGQYSARHHYSDMVLQLVLAAFWLSLTGFWLWDTITDKFAEIAHHTHQEELEQVVHKFADVLKEALVSDEQADTEGNIEISNAPFAKSTPIPVTKPRTHPSKVEVKRMVSNEQLKREQRNAKRRAERAAKKG